MFVDSSKDNFDDTTFDSAEGSKDNSVAPTHTMTIRIKKPWMAVAAVLFFTTAAMAGVAIGFSGWLSSSNGGGSGGVGASDENSDKNTMTCDMDKAMAMDAGFTMMPMMSIDMSDNMMTMGSMTFVCMGEEGAKYEKMTSALRTMDNGNTETVWTGAIMAKWGNGGQTGFATIVQAPDGAMAGSFTTRTATYSLMQAPDGTMQMKTITWADLPEEGDVDDDGVAVVDGYSNVTLTMEAVVIPTAMNGTVASEDVDSANLVVVETGSHTNRQQRQLRARNLQSSASVIRVLVIVTHRAACENAGLSAPCDNNSDVQGSFTRRVPILVSQTNTAMQGVRVDARIEIVGTIFLTSSFEAVPDSAALMSIQTHPTFVAWRNEYSADLVALITGDDGGSCGLGYLPGFATATSHVCLDGYTFTHELGHNMGARHDLANSEDQHDFAHGHRLVGNFRTIMSYNAGCDCPRIPYFSADGFTYMDQPLGTATEDNARQLRLSTPTTASAFV